MTSTEVQLNDGEIASTSTTVVHQHVEPTVKISNQTAAHVSNSDEGVSRVTFHRRSKKTKVKEVSEKKIPKGNIRGYSSGQATSAFQQRVNEIRDTRVNWQCYRQGNMISAEDYTYIAKYDYAMSPDVRDRLLRQDEMETGRVFLNLLSRVSKDQTVQYVLTLIDDMLQEDHTRAEIFRKYCLVNKMKLWDCFFTFLVRPDPFIRHQAARVISKLACWCDKPMEPSDLNYYLSWLREQMNQQSNDYAETAARNLQMLLRMPLYRETFVQHEGIRFIYELLCERPNFQMQYQLIFCLWCISFDPALIEQMREFNKLIPRLCDILSETIKEKVVRIILALFRHLLEKPQEVSHIQENALAMVQGKVLKQLELLLQKKIEDQELKEDVEEINEILASSVQDLTSLDEYTSELRSGRLEWSPVHRSERFWIENAHRLNEKNYELLKILVKLLETSKEPLILSVACHDIGEYVRHHPRGKKIIEQLGGKQLVMQLLQHEDANVRYHSLISLQKIMVHNWEYLGKQLEHDQEEKVSARAK